MAPAIHARTRRSPVMQRMRLRWRPSRTRAVLSAMPATAIVLPTATAGELPGAAPAAAAGAAGVAGGGWGRARSACIIRLRFGASSGSCCASVVELALCLQRRLAQGKRAAHATGAAARPLSSMWGWLGCSQPTGRRAAAHTAHARFNAQLELTARGTLARGPRSMAHPARPIRNPPCFDDFVAGCCAL